MPTPTFSRRAAMAALAGFGLWAAAPIARAQALSLDTARAQGLVGEQTNGYVGVVRQAPGVQDLVDAVNAQRRSHYAGLAQRNNVPVAAVEAEAGQELIARAQPGWFIQDGGQWRRK